MNLTGKVAIVTGGAQGIGKALCLVLLQNNAKVLFCDIDDNASKRFLGSLPASQRENINFLSADVRSMESLKAVFEEAIAKWGRVDIVVNNAGIFNEIDWRKTIDVNLVGVINGIKLAVEFMGKDRGRSGGHVINMASISGLDPVFLGPIYTATKHGVVGVTRTYSGDGFFSKHGIIFSVLCPSIVESRMFREDSALTLDKAAADAYLKEIKTITMEDVAVALLRLIQDGFNGGIMKVSDDGAHYMTITNEISDILEPGI